MTTISFVPRVAPDVTRNCPDRIYRCLGQPLVTLPVVSPTSPYDENHEEYYASGTPKSSCCCSTEVTHTCSLAAFSRTAKAFMAFLKVALCISLKCRTISSSNTPYPRLLLIVSSCPDFQSSLRDFKGGTIHYGCRQNATFCHSAISSSPTLSWSTHNTSPSFTMLSYCLFLCLCSISLAAATMGSHTQGLTLCYQS